jgi:hypothetical protein
MVATQQDCELISSIIKFGDIGSEATVRQGMKTTNQLQHNRQKD